MNSIIERFLNVSDSISRWSGKIIAFGIILNCIVVGYDVFLRYVLHSPIYWGLELNLFIFGTYFMIGAAYTLLDREYVSMDAIYLRLSLKKRMVLDIFGYLIILIFLAFFLWQAIRFTAESWRVLEISDSMWGPILYPIKTVIPIGISLVMLQALANFVRIIRGIGATPNEL